MNTLVINSIDRIDAVAETFLSLTNDYEVIAFNGQMGVGKTTFIKALCKKLDVIDQVTSPTFAIINEYATAWDDLVYHFDFYRINNLKEALDIGVEDYLLSGWKCFIECPKLLKQFFPIIVYLLIL